MPFVRPFMGFFWNANTAILPLANVPVASNQLSTCLHIDIFNFLDTLTLMKAKKTCIERGGLTAAYLEEIAQLLKMLAHPHRLKLVEIMEREKEIPTHRLIDETGLPQSAVSLHLNHMKRMGLLQSERRGREVWYQIKDPRVLSLLNCICSNCPDEAREQISRKTP